MTQPRNPWVEISPSLGIVATTICFLVGHDTTERFTFGGRGTRMCTRCYKRWECHLAPYSRSVSY